MAISKRSQDQKVYYRIARNGPETMPGVFAFETSCASLYVILGNEEQMRETPSPMRHLPLTVCTIDARLPLR